MHTNLNFNCGLYMQMLCLCSALLFVLYVSVGNNDSGFCDYGMLRFVCESGKTKFGNNVIHVHLYSSVKTTLISWMIKE